MKENGNSYASVMMDSLLIDRQLETATTRISQKISEATDSKSSSQAEMRILFEERLMGIEVPRELGGLGCTTSTKIRVIEGLAKVDPSAAVLCDI